MFLLQDAHSRSLHNFLLFLFQVVQQFLHPSGCVGSVVVPNFFQLSLLVALDLLNLESLLLCVTYPLLWQVLIKETMPFPRLLDLRYPFYDLFV